VRGTLPRLTLTVGVVAAVAPNLSAGELRAQLLQNASRASVPVVLRAPSVSPHTGVISEPA